MRKLLMLVLIIVFGFNISSALEPVAVSIIKTDNANAVAVSVELNDYSTGSAVNKLANTSIGNLTPNSSGVISFVVDGTAWSAIAAGDVNSHYILDVYVNASLYAQYRLDELVMLSSSAEVESAKTYKVGDLAQGGYVFYVTPNGKHGLACQLQDYSSQIELEEAKVNASNPNYSDSEGKNYTNWRIPTLYEITLLYLQKTAIGGFTSGLYWTSTKYPLIDQYYLVNLFDGTYNFDTYTYPHYIRYVRSF